MVDLVVVSFAVGAVLMAVEEFIYPIARFRALLAITASTLGFLSLGIKSSQLPVYGLAGALIGLFIALTIEDNFSKDSRKLPNRVPRR